MSQLSQYYYGVHTHGVLTDNACTSVASYAPLHEFTLMPHLANSPECMAPYPYSPNVVSLGYSSTLPRPPAESSAVQRRAKRAASPEDEAAGKGKEKRRRTAADVSCLVDLLDDVQSSLRRQYSQSSHKENRFNCSKCKKSFSSLAILRRHGDCTIQVKDRKHISCTADGCKSRQVFCHATLDLT
jgi:hypothetical protein